MLSGCGDHKQEVGGVIAEAGRGWGGQKQGKEFKCSVYITIPFPRPTMIKYGIDNIRDLVGHKVDFEMVYSNPICRL